PTSRPIWRAMRSLPYQLLLERREDAVGTAMALHRNLSWLAPLAMAMLMLVPASQVVAAVAPPITVAFDHLPTGFELDGVHRDLPCESCHLNAVFKGTPRDCGTCHIAGSQFNATPKT